MGNNKVNWVWLSIGWCIVILFLLTRNVASEMVGLLVAVFFLGFGQWLTFYPEAAGFKGSTPEKTARNNKVIKVIGSVVLCIGVFLMARVWINR